MREVPFGAARVLSFFFWGPGLALSGGGGIAGQLEGALVYDAQNPGRRLFILSALSIDVLHRYYTGSPKSDTHTMKIIIAVLALFLTLQVASAQATRPRPPAGRPTAPAPPTAPIPPRPDSALPISLPDGGTIANATPQQLADAVAAAIQANPGNAQAIATAVAKAIAGLPNATALATALATAIASNVPAANVAGVIAAAAAAASDAGNAGLASTMAGAAAAVVPSQAAAISSAVAAAVPSEAGNVANAVSTSSGGNNTTTSFPGNTQNTTQNPANFNAGQTNSPSN